jgi:hypothetical protein
MDRINIEMNPGEAILALNAVNEAAADAFATWRRLMATDAPTDEQAAARAVGEILSRVAARLSSALYPECAWWQECEALATEDFKGRMYCSRHAAQLRGQLPVFAA